MDLISGDDYNKPATENLLALVPASEPLTNVASEQNVLRLAEMFPPIISNSSSTNPANRFDSTSGIPAQQTYPAGTNIQLQVHLIQQPALFTSGGIQSSGAPQFEQASRDQGVQLTHMSIVWDGQLSPAYNPEEQALSYGKTITFSSHSLHLFFYLKFYQPFFMVILLASLSFMVILLAFPL